MFKLSYDKLKQSMLDRNNPIKEKPKMIAWKEFANWAYLIENMEKACWSMLSQYLSYFVEGYTGGYKQVCRFFLITLERK
ncbi:hypothetical protein OSB04_029895 [Centaurea solstitialis]|uniref:Uncharacterized protein n=1 Tax=Centaurea solstitialis TaxID=347529 RepID=A0AA38SQ23_9ASTR|nr:hypothetical protein OSB04_029895 [Centaurea solstitialis]